MSLPSEIPALGKIAGLARKEPIYDTELVNTTPDTTLNIFSNFTSFTNSSVTNALSKTFGRDTNLTGSQGGLPQAHRHMWYKWRSKFRTMDADLTNASNASLLLTVRKFRQLSHSIFQLAQTRYISVQSDELIGWTESEAVATTLTANYSITPSCGPSLGRDVTVGGEPKILEPLESFYIIQGMADAGNISTITFSGTSTTGGLLYITHVLDGVLTRGITG